jgi:hypothetical protein
MPLDGVYLLLHLRTLCGTQVAHDTFKVRVAGQLHDCAKIKTVPEEGGDIGRTELVEKPVFAFSMLRDTPFA